MKLIAEVLDHAPDTLTTGDRLLLVVIADNVNDNTREGWPGWELLARRMRWDRQKDGGKGAVRVALAGMASRGVDVRVPIAQGKDGRPVYAANGRRTVYRIPPLQRGAGSAPLEGGQSIPPLAEEGGQSPYAKGGNPHTRRGAASAPPSSHEPSENPHTPRGGSEKPKPPPPKAKPGKQQPLIPTTAIRLPEATQVVLDGLRAAGYPGATPDDAAAVHRAVCQRYPGKVNLRYLRTMASNRSYGTFFEEIKQARAEQVEAAIRELQRTGEPCEHGNPGGRSPHPTTGIPLFCPLCREGLPPAPKPPPDRTHPDVRAALDAYRNAGGPFYAATMLRLTQEAKQLVGQGVPGQQIADLARKAAQAKTGLLAAAVAR